MSFPIDVIIPSHNRADLLVRAIESVLLQTYQNFNLYVVNDGSTDDSELKIASYFNHPKFHYLKQTNKGVSAARNLGIKNSNSPWIAFLDSDDEWLPNKLEAQVNYLLTHPECRFIHSNEIWIRNGVRINAKNKFDKSNNNIFQRSLEMCLISPSTSMLRRDLITEHHFFNEEFVMCEDYDLWLKILAREDVAYLPDYLVKKYGGHSDQLSTKDSMMDYWRIQSLITLAQVGNLEKNKHQQVIAEINKKAPILLAGLQKHNQEKKSQEILSLLNRLLT
jgi:glycosyltransferase involved in cell wall biosynthesis